MLFSRWTFRRRKYLAEPNSATGTSPDPENAVRDRFDSLTGLASPTMLLVGVLCSVALVSSLVLLPASGHEPDEPSTISHPMNMLPNDVARMIVTNIGNTVDVARLAQASKHLSMSAHARNAMASRRIWESMFRPEATPGDLLAYSCEAGVHHRAYVSAAWARERIQGKVASRPQILLLEHLFSVSDLVSTTCFETTLKAMVVDWGLAARYALGTAIRHASNLKLYTREHRELALGAFSFLLRNGLAFPTTMSADGTVAQAVSDFLAADIIPLRGVDEFDESDPITCAMLQSVPQAHRDLVRVALGRCLNDLVEEEDLHGDLLDILVAHGLDINREWMDDRNYPWTFLKNGVITSNFEFSRRAIELGAEIDNDLGEWWHYIADPDDYVVDNNDVREFVQRVMAYSDDPAEMYANLAGGFERWRHRLYNDEPLVLFKACLAAVRLRYGPRFDASAWKHRVFVKAVDDGRIPIHRLLSIVDEGTVILTGDAVSVLSDINICREGDVVPVLDRIIRKATHAEIQAALTYVNELGNTVLHKRCMTVGVIQWIQRRSPTGFLWRALHHQNHMGRSCLKLWMQSPSPWGPVAATNVFRILETLASGAFNGAVSAYEVGIAASAGSTRVHVQLLSVPCSVGLLRRHLTQHASPFGLHTVLLMMGHSIGASQYRLETVDKLCALESATSFRKRYDGLTVLQRAVLIDYAVVDILLRHAKRLGVLNELVVDQGIADGWTVLHTGATAFKAALAGMERYPEAQMQYQARLKSVGVTLLEMVRTLPERLASADDFCRLVNARDSERRETFVDMLRAPASSNNYEPANAFSNDIVARCTKTCSNDVVAASQP